MSSLEPPKQTLIPAGLPLPYIGGYAVVGLASLAYISVMLGGPNGAVLYRESVQIAEPGEAEEFPAPEKTEKDPTIQIAEAEPDNGSATADVTTARQPEAESLPAPEEQIAAGEPPRQPSPGIETKYVTTQQILASRQDQSAPQSQPETDIAAATPQSANTSNIVTGSITVPPPPERAPPPPAVIRAALKPAVAPVIPNQAKVTPKAPAAPINFGPAVVTEANDQPEQQPALAVLLATGSSVESLRITWNILRERHGAALVDLAPRYIVEQNPSAPERSYALLAGPVISATSVARVCGALVSEGLTCRTRTFAGKPL